MNLTQARLRILNIVMLLHSHGFTVTVRSVAEANGTNINDVYRKLKALRKLGLITWEPTIAATIRPTCVFIPASCLGDRDAIHA